MAKKVRFPKVEACRTFVDVRRLLSQVRWQSPEYEALMFRWRMLCRVEIGRVQANAKILWASQDRTSIVEQWRQLYEKCPSGSVEEVMVYGMWQGWMPHDPDLYAYRERALRDAHITNVVCCFLGI